jgi:hypothetical protein
VLLVAVTVTLLLATARNQQADDPRSSTPAGTAALAQLLRDEGVTLSTTDRVPSAVRETDAGSTLVVADPDRLAAGQAQQLLAAGASRVVLVRPGSHALAAFGLAAEVVQPADGPLAPGCADPDAQRAGPIAAGRVRFGYRATTRSELACYPTGAGYAQLRLRVGVTDVDLVAGGLANDSLSLQGNAAFGTAVLGSRPHVVWLMSQTSAADATGEQPPTLLPGWWQLAVVQAFLALVVLGVWRGRRLGPILVEPLPVTVRASETVEGHGRLYYRLSARERAAEALRSATRLRLGRAFGHREDPDQLSAVIADRTGADVRSVHDLLYGGVPETDEQLRVLALDLDRLEQEARRL